MQISRRVYIAGAISSRPYVDAWCSFRRAELFLKRAKFDPVNPMFYCCKGWSHLRCMAVCLDLIQTCGTVYVLKGYEDSLGVKLELEFARKLGLLVVYSVVDF